MAAIDPTSENKRRKIFNNNSTTNKNNANVVVVDGADGAIETLMHSAQTSVRLMESKRGGGTDASAATGG